MLSVLEHTEFEHSMNEKYMLTKYHIGHSRREATAAHDQLIRHSSDQQKNKRAMRGQVP